MSSTPGTPSAGRVRVTFRLTLAGSLVAGSGFALESWQIGAEGGAIYLCSPWGGVTPLCLNGSSYEEVLEFPPGARVHYRFWRAQHPMGIEHEIKTAEFTVRSVEQVIAVTYAGTP